MEYLGRTRIQITRHHLTIDLTHNSDLVTIRIEIQITGECKSFQKRATLIGNVDSLATIGTNKEDFIIEIRETENILAKVQAELIEEVNHIEPIKEKKETKREGAC